jgi:hypothetical protein
MAVCYARSAPWVAYDKSVIEYVLDGPRDIRFVFIEQTIEVNCGEIGGTLFKTITEFMLVQVEDQF